jgi:hypothetical protein
MQCLEDRLDNAIEFGLNICIPETQHTVTRRSQETVPPSIVGRALNVLTTVQFDDDPTVQRGEVANIESDLMLSAELETADLSAPQTAPEQALRVGLVFSESAHMLEHARIWSWKRGDDVSIYTTYESNRYDPSAP